MIWTPVVTDKTALEHLEGVVYPEDKLPLPVIGLFSGFNPRTHKT